MAELVAKVYSQALFQIGLEQDSLESFLSELKIITKTCTDYPEFYDILRSPKVRTDEKKKVVDEVFSAHQSQEMTNFIKIILDKRRIRELMAIAREFENLIDHHKGIVKAIAYTTKPLDNEEIERLQKKISEMSGKQIELINKIDENLIGGVLIKLGDRVIDGTLKGKLDKLQNSLKEIIV